jgi:hypothetical protein
VINQNLNLATSVFSGFKISGNWFVLSVFK